MKDYIVIGPVPCNEDYAQVGQDGYQEQAVEECTRFIDLLRKTFGDEPEGARLAIKWFEHDFGSYCEVIFWYETADEKTQDDAFRCENEMPLTWEGGRREQLRFSSG
jgi:hypothetical protein